MGRTKHCWACERRPREDSGEHDQREGEKTVGKVDLSGETVKKRGQWHLSDRGFPD